MSKLENLKAEFRVKDLLQDTSKIVFVLESPHKQEVLHSAPVAGLSGKTMTRKLFPDEDLPLGLLLKNFITNKDGSDKLSKIGIMNICPVPMQSTAYPENVQEIYMDYLSMLEKIRTLQGKKKRTDSDLEKVLQEILNDFANRVEDLNNKDVLFVPCGNFARFMFKEAMSNNPEVRYLDKIPHPSYNSWGQKRYQDIISVLMNEFDKI